MLNFRLSKAVVFQKLWRLIWCVLAEESEWKHGVRRETFIWNNVGMIWRDIWENEGNWAQWGFKGKVGFKVNLWGWIWSNWNISLFQYNIPGIPWQTSWHPLHLHSLLTAWKNDTTSSALLRVPRRLRRVKQESPQST